MEKFALVGHLLGAFVFVSGIVVAGVGFEAARRRSTPAEVVLLLGLTRIGVLLVAVGAVVVTGFGFWLVSLGHWGFGAGWVAAALALLVVATAIGAVAGQRPKQARRLARCLADDGAAITPQLRAMLDDRVSITANYLSALLIVVIIVVMVFKPGATHG
jgi:uncharacterized membrane protein